MDANREKLIEDLYQRTLDVPPDQRAKFLSEECAGDSDLREEVEALLRHAVAAPTEFLAGVVDASAQEAIAGPLLDGMVGRTVGRYRLQRVIASGGMGTVYEAQQEQPNRTVAVKLIRQGLGSSAGIRRFQYESEVLGQLSHPGIAQIFESGVHREPGGMVPYFAMEYLPEATPITAFAAKRSLSIKDRIRLFLLTCDAVQYAHQRAVIHRDLKPANILVTSDGRPKLIDFGIARAQNADVSAVTAQTLSGQFLGTLRYMSPEQCGPTPADVDARTDVYALGVILFELLTGRLPYDLGSFSSFDAPQIIRERTPTRPSDIKTDISVDLDVVILKAMEKERDHRYQTVADFAADVRRCLNNEPIEARRHSAWYVARKTLRRHALLTSIATAFVLLTTAAAIALGILYGRAEQQRQAAQENFERASLSEQESNRSAAQARAATEFLNEMLSSIEPETARGRDVSILRELFDEAAKRVHTEFQDQPTVAATLADTIGSAYTKLGLLDEAEPLLREALVWREGALPADHPEVADSLNSLAKLLKHRGDLDAAEPLYRRALDINIQVYGEGHEVTITAMNNLGVLLKAKGQRASAATLYRKALSLSRQLHGSVHPNVARGLHNLAMLHRAQRDHKSAITMFEEAVVIYRQLYGERHPRLAMSLANLGAVLADAGRTEEGAAYVREAVAIGRLVYEPTHPELGRLTLSLANVENDLGRAESAERLYLEAIATLANGVRADEIEASKAKNNLALLLKTHGRFLEAGQLYREVIADRRRLLGDNHKSLLAPRFNLARLLYEKKELVEAESLAQDVVGMLSAPGMRPTGRTATALLMLGSIRGEAGRWESARDPLQRAFAIRETLNGGTDVGTLEARVSLGQCLAELNRTDEAESHLVQTHAELEARGEVTGAQAGRVASLMEDICRKSGRTEEAARWRKKAALSSRDRTDQGSDDQHDR